MSGIVGISDIRTVPVGEDLTKEALNLEILRGLEKMFRVDKKVGSGVSVKSGEFAVLGNDGMLSRPGATPVAETYLVFAGTDRFDSKATGQCTLIMSSALIVKTDLYDKTQSYNVGDELTSKNRGMNEADLTKASTGEFTLGKVTEVGSGYIVYELYSAAHVKA